MEEVNAMEIERKIEYWQHMLTKIEEGMLRKQSERVEAKRMLEHLHIMQKRVSENSILVTA